eukprot:scaffold8.g1724.t1
MPSVKGWSRGTDERAFASGAALLRTVPPAAARQAGVLLQVFMACLAALRQQALAAMPAWAAHAAAAVGGGSGGGAAAAVDAAGLEALAAALAAGGTEEEDATEVAAAEGSFGGSLEQREHGQAAQGAPAGTAAHAAGRSGTVSLPARHLTEVEEGPTASVGGGGSPLWRHFSEGDAPGLSSGSLRGAGGPGPSGVVASSDGNNGGAPPTQQQAALVAASLDDGSTGSGTIPARHRDSALPAGGGAVAGAGSCELGARRLSGRGSASAAGGVLLGPGQVPAALAALAHGVQDVLPALLRAALLVAPTPHTLELRQRLAAAFRAVALAMGEGYALAVLAPMLLAAAGAPDWQHAGAGAGGGGGSSAHVAALCARLAPGGDAQAALAGRAAALPLLLGGALPACGPGALLACLRRLCSDAGTGQVWALQHPQATVEAVRFATAAAAPPASALPGGAPAPAPAAATGSAGGGGGGQPPVVGLMWELAVAGRPAARLAAALLAGAAAPALRKTQVLRQLLPALMSLAGDDDARVAAAGLAAAAEVWRALPGEAGVQEALQGEFGGGREGAWA